jgi:hypothetical protein
MFYLQKDKDQMAKGSEHWECKYPFQINPNALTVSYRTIIPDISSFLDH